MENHIWNTKIASMSDPHILQSWEWGEIKAHYGWKPIPVLWQRENVESGSIECVDLSVTKSHNVSEILRGTPIAAAMILKRTFLNRRVIPKMNVMYVPKGPLILNWSDSAMRERILDDLKIIARLHGAVFIKIDPDVLLGLGIPGDEKAREVISGKKVISDLRKRDWIFSNEQIQFRNTVRIDLTHSEEDLLAQMKQKTRYNVRLAKRKGVSVRSGTKEDIDLLYQMYAETSLRDGFTIRNETYYRHVWELFLQTRNVNTNTRIADPLIAEVGGDPVAAVIILRFMKCAWYFYGMSRPIHRDKMPNYLLQWEAIRRAKASGCVSYDLWGAPDIFDDSDPMWGVYRFKRGLGGEVVRTIGAWDLPLKPNLYRLYTQILPRILSVMRLRGESRTKQYVSN